VPAAPSTTATTPAAAGGLHASELTWRPAGRDAPTLDGLDLTFAPGDRVLLAGASGSGKSTLLRALAGLLDETVGDLGGAVTLDGRDPQDRPGAVGLLLQDPRDGVVAEHVGRDVAFGPENRALARPDVQARVLAALDAVSFPYDADRATAALSGGEGARLALAGALALGPEVLLLDEPTAMLDAAAAGQVRDAVRDAADAAGLTLVVAEHQLGPWLHVCTRLVVLDRGKVLADGPTTDVLREQAEVLLAAGVWVPDVPDPAPLPVPAAGTVGRPASCGLRWTGLAVSAPDGRPLTSGVNGRLGPGDGLAVVGPSGAGKSTLLRVLAGLAPATSGQVELGTADGWRPVAAVARSSSRLARHVGWASQHSEETFTARHVLAEVRATGESLHAGDAEALGTSRARADLLIDALGLGHLRDEDPYALSGGEQRRVVLAAALAHDPDVLLLDEPTVGQDRRTWAAVAGVLDAARRGGAAVVATTHDPRLAERLGARLALAAPPVAHRRPDHRVRPVVEPGLPPAGRCNPLALLVVAVLAGTGSFWVDSAWTGLLTLLPTLALSPLAVRRVRPALVRLVPVALAALSVGWSTLLLNAAGPFAPGSGLLATREITRILCLVVPGVLVVGLLRPSTLGDALGQRLRLPARPVVAATAALLRLDDLLVSWQTMSEIRRVRGLAPGRSPAARVRHALSLTFALLVGTLRSAQQLALSMDARGFAAVRRRTHALASPFTWRDLLCLAVGLLLLAVPLSASHLMAGF
jgi:energy-coupling factor transporter ATP-binding protein EcfA2/energy-coupling factor transporter transmembrane protein EcfT